MNKTLVEFPSVLGNELLGGYIAGLFIKNCIVITHIGKGCLDASINRNLNLFLKKNGLFFRNSTSITESIVISGGVDCLRSAVIEADKTYEADCYLVLSNYIPEIIGDDLQSVVVECEKTIGKDVIGVRCGAFDGDVYMGFEKTMDIILKRALSKNILVDNAKHKKSINIFGIVPIVDLFWKGNNIELERIAKGLNIDIMFIGGKQYTLAELSEIAMADLNLILSENHGLSIATLLEEKHNIPSIQMNGYPIGIKAVEELLLKLYKQNIISKEHLEKFILQEKEFYYGQLGEYLYQLSEIEHCSCAVIAGIEYVEGIRNFLQSEVGMEVEVVCPINLKYQDKSQKNESEDFYRLCKNFEAVRVDFILGRTSDRAIAKNMQAAFVNISAPTLERVLLYPTPYIGIEGGLALLNDLLESRVKTL